MINWKNFWWEIASACVERVTVVFPTGKIKPSYAEITYRRWLELPSEVEGEA